jgi:hypothetical protein|tara:strand:- start:93 stop:359 length:267 start_codon:yes stop_codon:yes gene_type:complete
MANTKWKIKRQNIPHKPFVILDDKTNEVICEVFHTSNGDSEELAKKIVMTPFMIEFLKAHLKSLKKILGDDSPTKDAISSISAIFDHL